jgi:hypothetical protein
MSFRRYRRGSAATVVPRRRCRGVALVGSCLALLATACADPSRVVSPPPHVGIGGTVANGGLALTVQRVEVTEFQLAERAAPTYGLDFSIVVQNRAWRDGGVSLDRRFFSLEGAGTDSRLVGFRPCGRAESIVGGESVEGTVRFVLDAAPAPKATLVLRSPTDAGLVRVDFAPLVPRRVPAPSDAFPRDGGSDERPFPPRSCGGPAVTARVG